MRHVWFGAPLERSILADGCDSLQAISFYLGGQPTAGVEYHRLSSGYQSVELTRNHFAFKFMEASKSDDDTLVMLDDDHEHAQNVVEVLVQHNKPLVGALAFKRKPPFNPVAYIKDPKDGKAKIPRKLPKDGLYKVQRVGFAAVAIQKKVFDTLAQRGFSWPWFRFTYTNWQVYYRGGEDINFCNICDQCMIPMYCDFGLVSPHIDTQPRGEHSWKLWLEEHPDLIYNGESLEPAMIEEIPYAPAK